MESEVARFGFGYDSATDDYKVVRIMEFRTSNGFCSSEVKGNLHDGNAVIVQRQHQDPSTSKKRKFANRQFSFMSI
ncbi:PREDICTED: PRUPE_1G556300 [Prunus dulcis]|uniref:PREDICTED: PRUPE_1G556300 n=1 Tax=Prunus dulcis TaxID=3755 RepID=A0A5E4F1J6_PRUDU|nr:PREDICTED: PRUPE_1G556300 [Prunus dulcis]